MKKMGLYGKIFGGFIIILILMVIIGSISYSRMSDGATTSTFVSDYSLPIIENSENVVIQILEAGYNNLNYANTFNSESYNRAVPYMAEALKSAEFIVSELSSINYDKGIVSNIQKIADQIKEYQSISASIHDRGRLIQQRLDSMQSVQQNLFTELDAYWYEFNKVFDTRISETSVTRERLREILSINNAAHEIYKGFNEMSEAGLEGFHNRDAKMIRETINNNLPDIRKNIEYILARSQTQSNIDQLNNVSINSEEYAKTLGTLADDIEYIAQHTANRVVSYNNVKDGAGEFAQTISGAAARRTAGLATGMVSSVNLIIWLLIASIILGLTLAWLITSGIVKPVSIIINDLASGSNEVASASGQVSSSGQELAKNANEQASSLEETSASLEELASMTKQNTENARQVNIMSSEAKESSVKGRDTVEKMTVAITKIKESSDETVKIIKTIDEIAFQTNLLALNAAVEAARAGEAGKGFAVVAEEVRNLAQRAGEAAKNTAVLIDESKNNSEQGVKVAEEVSTILGDITGKIIKMNELAVEVASASEEQTKGIDQINTAVSQIEKITQANAANSEESAAASEELTAQSEKLLEYVEVLRDIVYGENHNGNESRMNRERNAGKTGMNLKQKTIAKTTPKATAKHTPKTKAEEIIPLDDSDF